MTHRFTYHGAYSTVFTVFIYIVALSMIWLILRTLDVRISMEGGGMCLYDCLMGNAASAVLIIVLITVAVVIYTYVDTFGYITALAVVITVMTMVSSVMYHMDYERDTVSTIERNNEDYLAEPGEPEVHRLDDGIPETPAGTDVRSSGC